MSVADSSDDDARELQRLLRFLTRPGPSFGVALALYADERHAHEQRETLIEELEADGSVGALEQIELRGDIDLFTRLVEVSRRAPLIFVTGMSQLLVDPFGRPRRSTTVLELNQKRDDLPKHVEARVVFWLAKKVYPRFAEVAWDLDQVMLTTAEFRRSYEVRLELPSRATPSWFERVQGPEQRERIEAQLANLEAELAGDPGALSEADAAASAGTLALRLGEVARGVELLRRSADAAERGEEPIEASRQRRRLAEIHILDGDLEPARQQAELALALVERSAEPVYGAELLRREAAACEVLLAELDARVGQFMRAVERLDARLTTLVVGEDAYAQASILAKLADLHEQIGSFDDAIALRDRQRVAFGAAGAEAELIEAQLELAQTYARAGRLQAALDTLDEFEPARDVRFDELRLRILQASGDQAGPRP